MARRLPVFFLGRGAQWRAEAGVDPANLSPKMARQMIAGCLSPGYLYGQFPIFAPPSDVARANLDRQASYMLL